MADPITPNPLDQLFREAHTAYGWTDAPLEEDKLRDLYALLKWGPTSSNSCPARLVWVRSPEGKEKLAGLAFEGNRDRINSAPVTVVIGNDHDFANKMPELMPRAAEKMQQMFAAPALRDVTAMRNGSLQGAYLIIAARALGIDTGPMSGFDNKGVDDAFFAGTNVKSNFICCLGHADPASFRPRNPRLTFEEASHFA